MSDLANSQKTRHKTPVACINLGGGRGLVEHEEGKLIISSNKDVWYELSKRNERATYCQESQTRISDDLDVETRFLGIG